MVDLTYVVETVVVVVVVATVVSAVVVVVAFVVVVGTVNDSYLQSQGTPGTKSYGMVVDLAVAYHKSVTGIK